MACQKYKDQFIAYIEGLLDQTATTWLESHFAECQVCREQLNEFRQLSKNLVEDGQLSADISLDNKIMDMILRQQAQELRKMKLRKRYKLIGAGGAIAAAFVLFVAVRLAVPDNRARAAEVLAKG